MSQSLKHICIYCSHEFHSRGALGSHLRIHKSAEDITLTREAYEYADEETNADLFEVTWTSECHNQNEESIAEMIDEEDIEDLSQAETGNMEADYYPMSYDALTYMEDNWGHNFQEKVDEEDVVKISVIYEQFLDIIINYQLSDKAGDAVLALLRQCGVQDIPCSTHQARKFIEKRMCQTVHYNERVVYRYNDRVYIFYYQRIFHCINQLLRNKSLADVCVFDYRETQRDGDRVYAEQFESDWWRDTEKTLSYNRKLLSVILYSDATTCDRLSKTKMHPIYMIYHMCVDRKKMLNASLGIPIVEDLPSNDVDLSHNATTARLRAAAIECFHSCMTIILEEFEDNYRNGVSLRQTPISGEYEMRLSAIISDWPEAASYTLAYKSANSHHPCHTCLVTRDKLNAIGLHPDECRLRTPAEMKMAYEMSQCHNFSLVQKYNIFWEHHKNIYLACLPDRMHQLDLGLFKRMLELTLVVIRNDLGESGVNIINKRLPEIPRFRGLKVFRKGLKVSNITAKEYRDLMKVMPFVLEGVGDGALAQVYVEFNEMYFWARQSSFTEDDLIAFRDANMKWAQQFLRLFISHSPSSLQLPKLHCWLHHTEQAIRLYGALDGYSSETYESFHRECVKNPYRKSNKRQIESQMLATVKANLFAQEFTNKKTQKIYNPAIRCKDSIAVTSFAELDEVSADMADVSLRELRYGFLHIKSLLETHFMESNISIDENSVYIQFFASATLSEDNIVRANPNFYGQPWFSDVEILMDDEQAQTYRTEDGHCYGKALLVLRLTYSPNGSKVTEEFVMIQWYDYAICANRYKNRDERYKLNCPYMKLLDQCALISLQSITRTVHVVPSFVDNTKFYINQFA